MQKVQTTEITGNYSNFLWRRCNAEKNGTWRTAWLNLIYDKSEILITSRSWYLVSVKVAQYTFPFMYKM